jgi:hypothetical protein
MCRHWGVKQPTDHNRRGSSTQASPPNSIARRGNQTTIRTVTAQNASG